MPKFAFIAHPITTEHLYEIYSGFAGKILSFFPKNMLKELLLRLPPVSFGVCKNVKSSEGKTIEGEGFLFLLLPEQIAMLDEKFVLDKIAATIKKAKESGAQIAALGGFASVVGNEGEKLAKQVNGIAITSGNTCTAALTIQGILKAALILDVKIENTHMTVIGATGDIGSICSKIFAKKVKKLNIVARRQDRLSNFANALRRSGSAEVELFKRTSDAIKGVDIILSTTSSLTTLIEPEYLKPGAIVCDVSLPANIPKEIVNIRKDILVFEGGLAKLPYSKEIKGKNWNRLLPGDRTYGCLAEAMLLSFENRLENYSIARGNITEENIQEIYR